MRLYLDGVLQAEAVDLPSIRRTSAPVELGNVRPLVRPFVGVIDYLDIYSAALRPSEIDDLFAAASSSSPWAARGRRSDPTWSAVTSWLSGIF